MLLDGQPDGYIIMSSSFEQKNDGNLVNFNGHNKEYTMSKPQNSQKHTWQVSMLWKIPYNWHMLLSLPRVEHNCRIHPKGWMGREIQQLKRRARTIPREALWLWLFFHLLHLHRSLILVCNNKDAFISLQNIIPLQVESAIGSVFARQKGTVQLVTVDTDGNHAMRQITEVYPQSRNEFNIERIWNV